MRLTSTMAALFSGAAADGKRHGASAGKQRRARADTPASEWADEQRRDVLATQLAQPSCVDFLSAATGSASTARMRRALLDRLHADGRTREEAAQQSRQRQLRHALVDEQEEKDDDDDDKGREAKRAE